MMIDLDSLPIDHVSYSMMSLWERCKECWKYKYIMGIEGETPEPFRAGREYHEEVHNYHIGKEYNQELIESYTNIFDKGYRVKSELEIVDDNLFEIPFEARLDGIGKGYLTDLKFVSNKLSQRQADESLQATMYLYWYWSRKQRLVPFDFVCVNKKNKKVSLIRTKRKKKDFEQLQNKVKEFLLEVNDFIKGDYESLGPGCYPGCCEYPKICSNCNG